MSLKNAFGDIVLENTQQMLHLTLRALARVAVALDQNSRLRVNVEAGTLPKVTAVGTVTTVTTVTGVTGVTNLTNMGGVPAQYPATGQFTRMGVLYDNLKVT